MQWFRLYGRTIDDDKLRLLAFEDRWHFIALCCLKSGGLLDEVDSDLRRRRIALRMGVQLRELDEITRRLHEVGLIDETLNPVKWDDLQFRTDNSTERVRAYRKRQRKQQSKTGERSETVSVTPQETETDTDIREPKGSSASGDAPLTASEIVEDWNALAGELDLPKVVKLTPARRRALKVRLHEYPELEAWQRAFRTIRESPFLLGDNQRAWKADFDFLLQAKSFTKLTEGAYGQAG